ncbi:MAG: MarR family winged helix-turn-helix transcriptional regulator [Limisphaerales bacterium]
MNAVSSPANKPYQALVQLLRAADTVWDASRAFFARWDLSPSQFNVLNLLEGNPSGLSQTGLSRQLVMHRSNVTGLVDRLERRRLVKREDAAGDRRAYRVVLTPEGARLLGEVLPRYYEEARRVCEHLSERRAAELIADFRQIAQNAKRGAARLPRPEFGPPEPPREAPRRHKH